MFIYCYFELIRVSFRHYISFFYFLHFIFFVILHLEDTDITYWTSSAHLNRTLAMPTERENLEVFKIKIKNAMQCIHFRKRNQTELMLKWWCHVLWIVFNLITNHYLFKPVKLLANSVVYVKKATSAACFAVLTHPFLNPTTSSWMQSLGRGLSQKDTLEYILSRRSSIEILVIFTAQIIN